MGTADIDILRQVLARYQRMESAVKPRIIRIGEHLGKERDDLLKIQGIIKNLHSVVRDLDDREGGN